MPPKDRQHVDVHFSDIHLHLHSVGTGTGGGTIDLGPIKTLLDALKAQLSQGVTDIMATIQLAREALAALNSTTNELAAAVESVVAADQAEDDAFRAEIEALKAQIASGEAVTAEQLAELTEGMGGTTATLTAVRDALASMGTNPAEPIPPVDIPPVEEPEEPEA